MAKGCTIEVVQDRFGYSILAKKRGHVVNAINGYRTRPTPAALRRARGLMCKAKGK